MVANPHDIDALFSLAKARAAFCSFLLIHFNMLPDEKFVVQMRQEEIMTMLTSLKEDDAVHEDIRAGASLMAKFLQETRDDIPSKLSEKMGVDRTRLYRGLSPTYGPPPPYEMVWSQKWQDVTLLELLASLYRENGLQPSDEVHERQDYIGIQLDFINVLATREADAWEANELESAASLLKTQREFFKEHVESWIDYFIRKANEFVKTDFYQGHLLMLQGYLKDLDKSFSSEPIASLLG